MAPTVVLPLPERPATIRIIGLECSRAAKSTPDPEVVESFLRRSRWILGWRPEVRGRT
jgi:hypothetical protein